MLAVLIATFLVLLQPIVFRAARYYVDRLARDENLKISFEPGGNVWSHLSLKQIEVKPTAPGSVRDVRVGHISTSYSLWTLLRSGMRDFVTELEIEDVTIVLDVSKPPPPPIVEKG